MIGEIKLWENDGKTWEDRDYHKIYGETREELFEQAENISDKFKTEVRLEINKSGQGHYIGSKYKFDKIYGKG